MRWHIAMTALIASAALLTGCAAQGPQPMPVERAAGYYKRTVCPVVPAADTTDGALASGNLPSLHRAAAAAASVYRTAQRGLAHPPAPWPTNVVALMPALEKEFGKRVSYYASMQRASTPAAAAALPQPDMSAVSVPVDTLLKLGADFAC
jgi:hypothetical protein